MTKQLPKTNAARLLDRAGVKYSLNPYEVDEEDLSAVHVARQLGVDPGLLYKTLVMRGDRTGIFVCVIPGDADVDLKKAARVSGNKNADLIPMKELLPTVGYIRGACSPIGMKKRFPTFLDSSASEKPVIYISAGVRGLQIRLDPADLALYTDAAVADLTSG